ncbi:RNA 3'-terminal phosphate cyclase/enolpyruvate transferase [Fomes fomentarius]|nr:RNA 3'-terminal phosphate cyclase/enolpyruvate transferase [Fomes fomentarius]
MTAAGMLGKNVVPLKTLNRTAAWWIQQITTAFSLLDVYRNSKGVYQNPAKYDIESDASSAAYPLAIIAISGATPIITNIGFASLQGDPRSAVASLPSTEERTLRHRSRLPTTRIIGVANQRVKDCNRIKAMVDELAKFGVESLEWDDGLEVYGKPLFDEGGCECALLLRSCRDGAQRRWKSGEGYRHEEKRCVEKTWPDWWDNIENKIGLDVEDVEYPSVHGLASVTRPAAVAQNT